MRTCSLLLCAALAAAAIAGPAFAKKRVVDGGGVDACAFQDTFGALATDGSIEMPLGTFDFGCSSTALNTFSINIGGTFYNSMFVNENGFVSFGAPISPGPATPLGSFTAPAFAPFFADGAVPDTTLDLRYGWTDSNVGFPNSVWVTWAGSVPQGAPTAAPNIFQLGIVDLGLGDFDLIFNYEAINWDSSAIGAQAGVVTSLNNAVILAGAGIPGAYLGTADTSTGVSLCNSATPSTALACNNMNDGSQPIGAFDFDTTNGDLSNGYYLFKFRNGVLINAPVNEIPIPAAFGLFAMGLGLFGGRRLMQRRNIQSIN